MRDSWPCWLFMATSACSHSYWSAVHYKTGSLAKAKLFFIRDKNERKIISSACQHAIKYSTSWKKRPVEGVVSSMNHYRKWSSVTQRPVSAVSTADLCHAFLPERRGSDKMSERQGCACLCVCVCTFNNWKLFFSPLKLQFVWCYLAIKRLNRKIDAIYLEERHLV